MSNITRKRGVVTIGEATVTAVGFGKGSAEFYLSLEEPDAIAQFIGVPASKGARYKITFEPIKEERT